ncbi:MAG: glutathione S-transferase [Alphaproteobacteria bacterium]|nr:glutathione S-transferase [Alphaproteobacteria bacterium]
MIELYTNTTSNGRKISIALEELALPYNAIRIDTQAGASRTPEYLQINPNGKIPAIVDPDGPGGQRFVMFESAAILIYLADKTGRLLPCKGAARYATLEWVQVEASGVSPDAFWLFYIGLKEKNEQAATMLRADLARLYGVRDKLFVQAPDLACEELTIADTAHFPWVMGSSWQGIDLEPFPNLRRWRDDLAGRESFQKGMKIPA